ncbi:MAG: stage IV sporulation protein A [Lachnospiraceae bacterium]|nr:stage IV sporulation protein A [Lachnospiraceae bacterium]
MDTFHLYRDIQARTKGEIYIGVVGPVRSGKSTFVRRFMEQLVLPHISDENSSALKDELPVSGGGKTITTVEPKFVPAKAAEVELEEGVRARIRLIDCVGFVIDGAFGLDENNQVRMVKTPWSKEAIPFPQAAEIGTGKVIRDHATVGILVTTDGSTGDFERSAYIGAEEKTVAELRKTGKPFVIVLNSQKPYSAETKALSEQLEKKYGSAVVPVNCEQMKEEDIRKVLMQLLCAFPLTRIEYFVPRWIETLSEEHPVKKAILEAIVQIFENLGTIRDVTQERIMLQCDYVEKSKLENISLADGSVQVRLEVEERYYYEMLSQMAGVEINGEYQLISMIKELSDKRKEYESVQDALTSVKGCGYGVITPEKEDITLEAPVVMKQGSRYGVKIKAYSPSIHLIRADIETEIAPIVGSEQQARDLVAYIEENAKKENGIWDTNIFGKSVSQLVEDGIRTKLAMIGEESQNKLQETMKKIVNESNGRIICIII